MVSERKKNQTVESLAAGSLYAMPRKRRFRGRHLLIVLLVAAAGFGMYRGLRGPKSLLPRLKAFLGDTVLTLFESRPSGQPAVSRPVAADPFEIRHVTLHAGDALDTVFTQLNITGPNLDALRKACRSGPLQRIGESDELLLVSNRADGQPVKLVYLRAGGGAYTLRKNSSGWEWGAREQETSGSGAVAHCGWSKSFYHSCVACGIPEPIISSLADMFSYDVDITSDFKTGDTFSVFYQQYRIESTGEKRSLVLGAQMDVSGKVYQTFGFQLPDGSWDYFDEKGGSLERPFVRVPLDYRNLLRGDAGAVLKIFRPRFALMYIVPAGAKVCAVGDGVVSAVHRSSGRRFSIEIRHGDGYSSWYGNLAACSRGLRRGTPVRRLLVIGSAGAYGSGKAYFDFQFSKNGRPVNFQAAEFAPARTLPDTMAAEFAKTKTACLDALSGKTSTESRPEIPSGKK
ncbi:MAG: peptidoglycan DD-metalloendopeptidase family protein [Syntrophobacteraceae bacterium]|nr:peptidoglycan DD-metalloendopeptidase family protein [Syntrophobacteraceae bacterium]